VATLKTYQVDVERDGKFWRVHVPQVGRSTQARNLREIEPMAVDLIVIMDDIQRSAFQLDVRIALPGDVRHELEEAAELREKAACAQAEAARLSRAAAYRLHDLGLPLRDIGKVLGVSYQRAHQLVDEAGAAGTAI